MFVIALALVAGQTVPTPALQPGETLLEVSADGEAKGVPDVAAFSTGVTSDGATAQAALAANSKVAARLIDAVSAAGIKSADVRTEALRVGPRYKPDKDGDDTDEIIGYRASNRLTIVVKDIAAAPRIVDTLLAAGATDLSGPDFSFADDRPLVAKARSDAVASAGREASDYAAALNLRVGRVLRISERSARSDGSNGIVVTGSRVTLPPIQPGEQTTRVTVWIDYALVK